MLTARHSLFPTLVHQFAHPAAGQDNPVWRSAILQLRDRDAGRRLSNVNGWQSSVPLQTVPELASLARFVQSCLEQVAREQNWALDRYALVMEGWANINGRNAANNLHNHPNCLLSGTYYVDTPKGSGNIVFRDPRESSLMYQPPYAGGQPPPVAIIEPQPGMLLVFPSWLLHAVETNHTEGDRISVAFNAIAVPRPPPR